MLTAEATALPEVSLGRDKCKLSASKSIEQDTQSSSDDQDHDNNYNDHHDDDGQQQSLIKCSAVHSLERDMPDFDYSYLVKELRELILKEARENEGLFSQADINKCINDDWFLSRYLLRQKLELSAAFDMLKASLRYRNESLISYITKQDFPAEIYMLGGLFSYEKDRKGNIVIYIRGKVHRKSPEIAAIVQAFVYFLISSTDDEADGKGIAIVVDCSGAGLVNADMDIMLFLITTLKNYFPKGLSYFLIHELPFFLRPIWYIVKAWIPAEHKELIKFSDSRTIYEYVDADKLPDFLGGTCTRPYKTPPDNCARLQDAAKLWGIDAQTVLKVLRRVQQYLPPEVIDRAEQNIKDLDKIISKDEEEKSY